MRDGTPFLRVAADRIGAPGSARIAGKNAIPRHQRRQLVLDHPDRREDGRHSKANCTSRGFQPHSTGWEGSIWGIPVKASPIWQALRSAPTTRRPRGSRRSPGCNRSTLKPTGLPAGPITPGSRSPYPATCKWPWRIHSHTTTARPIAGTRSTCWIYCRQGPTHSGIAVPQTSACPIR